MIRLRYFVFVLTCAVLFSLLFTWQQVEIIKLAYRQGRN